MAIAAASRMELPRQHGVGGQRRRHMPAALGLCIHPSVKEVAPFLYDFTRGDDRLSRCKVQEVHVELRSQEPVALTPCDAGEPSGAVEDGGDDASMDEAAPIVMPVIRFKHDPGPPRRQLCEALLDEVERWGPLE